MSTDVDTSTQIDAVQRLLVERYGEQLSVDLVRAEVEAAAQELSSDARVRTFLSVLVQRRANERLRMRQTTQEQTVD
ncbi:MAG: three-helix bundle dimerization domain-containing protein [Actinomycetes bacterium]